MPYVIGPRSTWHRQINASIEPWPEMFTKALATADRVWVTASSYAELVEQFEQVAHTGLQVDYAAQRVRLIQPNEEPLIIGGVLIRGGTPVEVRALNQGVEPDDVVVLSILQC